jgi:hypothetical protein
MALAHSPKIATNGLLLCIDQGNIDKSWKGAPATNLFTETNLNNWTKTATTATSSFVTPFGDPVYEITDTNASSYLNVSRSITVANDSSSYTMSCFIKKTYGATSARLGFNTSFNGGTAVNYNQRFNSDTGVATLGTVIDYGDWWYWYFTVTNNSTGNTTFNCSFYPATAPYNTSDNVTGVGAAFIGGLMFVAGSVAARFANGTRSNTQTVLDLTRRNTITATSLTYASNNSFSFNGTSDYLTAPTFDMTTLSAQEITLEAWVNHTNLTGSQAYINNWYNFTAGDQRGVILRTFNDQVYPSFWWCWGANYNAVYASSFTMSPETWYHVVGTYTKNVAARIYVNGVLYNSTTDTSVNNDIVYDTTNKFNVGRSPINGSWMNGQIAQTNIYNRALTEAEIVQNFNAHRGRYGI